MGLKDLAKLGFKRDKERDKSATLVVAQPVVQRPLVREVASPAQQSVTRTRTSRQPVPASVLLDAADLRDRYEERAAICEFDGGRDRARAEARAWKEVANIWHRQHGTRTSGDLCAGCGEALGDEADVLLLPHGERAHADDGYTCIRAYGRRWKSEAAAALAALGIPSPSAAEIDAELRNDENHHPAT
jgi:hypothetical protein